MALFKDNNFKDSNLRKLALVTAAVAAISLFAVACGTDDASEADGAETTAEVTAGEDSATSTSAGDDAMEDETATETTAPETDSDTTEAESAVETTTTESSDTSAMADAGSENNIALFTIDGGDPIEFIISQCGSPTETTVTFNGLSEAGTLVDVEANDGEGRITIDGPEGSYEGSVDQVMVGDIGNVTISGTASVADDSTTAGQAPFELSGFTC